MLVLNFLKILRKKDLQFKHYYLYRHSVDSMLICG